MRGASTRTSAAADLVESGRGQRQTATWPLQHDKDLIGCRGARPFGVVVGGHRGEELSRDRHDPLATALALGDEQATLSRVQVGHPQAQYFAASQAGQQHGLDHCAVAVCAQHGQEGLRLGRFDHAWQGAWCPDQRGSPHPWTTTPPPGCQSSATSAAPRFAWSAPMRPTGSATSSPSAAPTRCAAWTRSMWSSGSPMRWTTCVATCGTTPAEPGRRRSPRSSKGARYALWKNPEDLTERQQGKLADIAKTNQRLYRAYLLKEQLRQVFH